jgi:hypothetical protein
MRARLSLRPPVFFHQGGWDEILLFFGAPVSLFVILRWLGLRKEHREQAEAGERHPPQELP